MGSKYLSLFFLALLALLSLLFAFPISANTNNKSSINFLKHVQGCHKGNKVKGILELKKYLKQFGYLDYKHAKIRTHENDDVFDKMLESAIKTYQSNFHLKPSGVLDRETLLNMAKPRCGVPDIVNGTNFMKSREKTHDHNGFGFHFHTTAHYAFFEGNLRWPPDKTHLNYAFLPGTRGDAMEPVARAFQTWQANTHFTFSRVEDPLNADLTIGFKSLDHGDGYPFDGPGKVLAHSFAPTDGRFHYDADDNWVVGAIPNGIDLQTVALHEIGHLLGLNHSGVKEAIMWATTDPGTTKGLNIDDIQGIKALYGV